MNCWLAFGLGVIVGLLPLIYGIFRALKMVGGAKEFADFNWNSITKSSEAKNMTNDNKLKPITEFNTEDLRIYDKVEENGQ